MEFKLYDLAEHILKSIDRSKLSREQNLAFMVRLGDAYRFQQQNELARKTYEWVMR